MREIAILKNPILPYAWGSTEAIPELLGIPADGTPRAEMWMGAHPKAPSAIVENGAETPLTDRIAADPEGILGPGVRSRFGDALPFLFKVLAAGAPLSIQAHPSLEAARAGFERENRAGIPLDAPHRNYRDPNHKPECIRALTPFWGLCGFRPAREAAALLDAFGVREPRLVPGESPAEESTALRDFFRELLTLPADRRNAAIDPALNHARGPGAETPEGRWVNALAGAYPGDPGILSPLFLNLVRLAPGEALFLPAGELHAYLDGLGVEIMANSDNVLRGGLTPKHVDVPELMEQIRFAARRPPVLRPEPVSAVEAVFATPAEEFRLSEVRPGPEPTILTARAAEILLGLEGEARLRVPDAGREIPLPRGATLLVPAAVGRYAVSGSGCFFRATTPVS